MATESKKYEFTGETKMYFGRTLRQIRAIKDFYNVKAGEIGGWIEKESNLSQTGNAWVYDDASVCDDARVCDDAWVSGNARVSGDANINNMNQYRVFGPAGSRNDFTTFFVGRDEIIYAKCGCFLGTVDDFCEKVIETHRDNAYAKEYIAYAEIAKKHIRSVRE